MRNVTSFISGKKMTEDQSIKGIDMRETLFQHMKATYPVFTEYDYISKTEYNALRRNYMLHLVAEENDEISSVEHEVVTAITENKILSEDIEPIIENQLTMGERLADKIAEFGGSWKFIILFFSLLLGWIFVNIWFLMAPIDPFPFILLNLILSCLAAVQAPIIMMSQNRVEQKDRLRSENDYKVNLKAELEIKMMQEKIDHLIFKQNKRLLEVQQIQIDYLEDIQEELKIRKQGEK